MSKHTKGPWRVVEANTPGVLYVSGPAQTLTIITAAIDLDFSDYVKRTSDAHLIAAAPELLEALEEIMDGYLYGCAMEVKRENIERARAAITKARGEA